MSQASDLVSDAIENHRNGRWDLAEHFYRQALEHDPRSLQAWLGLGLLLIRHQPTEQGIACLQQALAIEPSNLPTALNLAACLVAKGEHHEAEQVYQHALRASDGSNEDRIKICNNLGVLYHQLHRWDDAISAYEEALRLAPHFFAAQFNLGIAYRAAGRLELAVGAYRKALAIAPNAYEVFHDLGLVLDQQQKHHEAEAAYRIAIQGLPESPELLLNLGNNLRAQRRLDEAIRTYQRCLELRPTYAEAANSLGIAWLQKREFKLAQGAFQHAIIHRANYSEALYNLGTLYEETREHTQAIEAYRQAFQADPGFYAALDGLVNQYQITCDWKPLEDLSQRIIEVVEQETSTQPMTLIHPFSFIGLSIPTTPRQQYQCARRWGRQYSNQRRFDYQARWETRNRSKTSGWRIGYLSADFRVHAVGLCIPELLESHDRSRFEVFGYSIGSDDKSNVRQRIEAAFPIFRDLYLASHEEVAKRIWEDDLDFLIDLQGYTAHSRTEILAYRPAPIQIQYLGFPGTMGVDFIDYLLVDDFIVPPDQQPYYCERLILLPGCYQVNDRRTEIASDDVTRESQGLPEDAFVFCSFNSSQKLTAALFDAWIDILNATPESILWLPAWNPLAIANVRGHARSRGLADERIVFSPHLPIAQHLNRHRLASLFLDSYPYSGHGTASNALRMGLPVVTLIGQSMSSRVAGSLLRELGMSELVATNYKDYAAIAVGLANNRDALHQVCLKLQGALKVTTLYDGQAFARKLEATLIDIFRNHSP